MKNKVLALLPLILVLAIWQWAAAISPKANFLVSSPTRVFSSFCQNIANGELPVHTGITALETLAGFLIGVGLGSVAGFLLLYYPRVADLSRIYVVALGAIPPFALAPLLIIWFGVGIGMKVACAAFATGFVALMQAYQGGKSVPTDLTLLFDQLGASPHHRFTKLILPHSLDWILNSFKLNIGLALLGAFIGEFIVSDAGLGHELIKAGGLYDIPMVWASTLCIVILAMVLNQLVRLLEINRLKLIQFFTVPRSLQ